METSNNTLRNVINDTEVSNLNSYYTILGTQLFFRFSDTTHLETINVEDVREVARFSLACARVANDVINESWESERRRGITRQSRAA